MRFEPTQLPGVMRVETEPQRDERGAVRQDLRSGRVRRRRPADALAAMQSSRGTASGGLCAACITRRSRAGNPSWCAAPAAASLTWRWICGRNRPAFAAGSGSSCRRITARPLYSDRLRPRFSDPRGRLRSVLHDGRGVRPRTGLGGSLERPGFRHRLAIRAGDPVGARRELARFCVVRCRLAGQSPTEAGRGSPLQLIARRDKSICRQLKRISDATIPPGAC